MAGVYDGDPEQGGNNDHGTNFSFGDNGVLVLTEVGYTPQRGLLGLPARYTVGGYYHSGDFEDVGRDASGNNRLLSGLSGQPFSGSSGYYILLDQKFYREQPQSDQGLSGFLVVVLAPDEQENVFPYFASAGLVYQGLLDSRPKDKTALAIARGWYSGEVRQAQREAGLERQTAETVLELNHQIQITPALYVRPDVQYVVRPSGRRDIDNALVIGFEAVITF